MRSVKLFSVLVIVACLGVIPTLAAAHPVQTNFYGLSGLFFATGAKTLDSGALAAGGSFVFLSDDNVDIQFMPLTVTYGMSDDLELGAAFELVRSIDPDGGSSDSGIGDLYLSAKYSVQERTDRFPATSIGARLRVPTADKDVEISDDTDIALFMAAEMPLGSSLGIFNVEYLITGNGNIENAVNYAFGLRIPYTDTTNFSVELLDQQLFGESGGPLIGDILSGGALFDVSDHLNFGVAVGLGLNEYAADLTLDGKLTLTF